MTLPLVPREVLGRMTGLHASLFRPSAGALGHLQREIERAAASGQAQARFFPFHLLPPASAAPLYAAAVARDLYGARAYQVSAAYTDLATVLETSFPGFDEFEMPGPYGFAWLDKPWDCHGASARMLTWGLQPTGSAEPDADGGPAGGVRLAAWDDDGGLISAITVVEGQPGTDPVVMFARRLWALMDMQMTSTEPAGNGSAHQGYRPRPVSGDETVHVVELRHHAHDGSHSGTGEPGHPDWQFCWLVRGHRRRAPHGGTFASGRSETWVHAHIRGPADKPLKLPEILYRLGE